MKKWFLIISLICIIFVTGCRNEKEKLILVTEAGFAPYEYYDNGEIVGVDIDIAKEVAAELGMDLEIKDVAFDSIINEVKTGKSDIGAAGISHTEERAKEVDFTINYMESKQVLIVDKNSLISSPRNLRNEKIAVQLGSVADTYLTEKVPSVTVIREKKFLAAFQDLRDGKVDGVVMDEVPARELVGDDYIILDEELVTDYYGMIVSKGNTELLNKTNTVIKRLQDEGKIDEFLLKHMGVKSTQSSKNNSFLDKIYYTIIYDGRYQYILDGFIHTIIIALGAVILGSILGSCTAIIRNIYDNKKKLGILNYLAKGYVTVIRGTPSILQLMIIYYVIFKATPINILFVGIMAFGINSGAYVAEVIRAGINSVDKGQIEAGYALGLSYSQIMRYIVVPEALKNILPALGNEFITLVKETSVGAYIGIIELTKASDIIASRTYDYFFPLILIAFIYLAITLVLTKLIAIMERRLNHVRN